MILVNLRKQDERKETNEKYQEVEDAEEEIIAEEDDNLTAVNQKHSEKRDSAPVTNQESDKRTKNNKRQANESPKHQAAVNQKSSQKKSAGKSHFKNTKAETPKDEL